MSIGSFFKPLATGIGKAAKYLENNDAARMMAAGALGGASPRYGPALAAHLNPEDEGVVAEAPAIDASPTEQILQGPVGESGAGYAGGGGGGFGPEPGPMEPYVGRDFPRMEPLNLQLKQRYDAPPEEQGLVGPPSAAPGPASVDEQLRERSKLWGFI